MKDWQQHHLDQKSGEEMDRRVIAKRRILVTHLEAAAKGNRELSDEVLLACRWREEGTSARFLTHKWLAPDGTEYVAEERPSPTESLDAALTLVPEGHAYAILVYANGTAEAAIGDPPQFCSTILPTPALALCIAALKTRKAA